jgi:hypothetical protein
MKSLVVAIPVLLMLTGACHRERSSSKNRAGTTTATGAAWFANAGAVERIAAARCAREAACGHVGPNQRFADDQSCLRETARRASVEVDAETCPNGVDAQKVDRCESAISHEPCAEGDEPVRACRPEELCLRDGFPRR